MTDFMDMFCEMLPLNSSIQKSNNQFRKVLDKTLGEFMENQKDLFNQLFLTSATGGWLDAFGKDYGVSRRLDESDDSYRERIIFEKLEYLTAHNLQEIYSVSLFNAFDSFNPTQNDLTSDNPYLSDWYMGVVDTDTQKILDKKFILDGSVVWLNTYPLDFIFSTSDIGVLKQYSQIYGFKSLFRYFKNNTSIKSVKLTLPYATDCSYLFEGCTGLVSAELDLPNAFTSSAILDGCTNLKNVVLNVPNVLTSWGMLDGCGALESINVNIPSSFVDFFKSYVLGLDLANLDTFIVNGEEVNLDAS